jgi:hypothetical protein
VVLTKEVLGKSKVVLAVPRAKAALHWCKVGLAVPVAGLAVTLMFEVATARMVTAVRFSLGAATRLVRIAPVAVST